MSIFNESDPNPYRAPSSELRPNAEFEPGTVDRALIKKFRDQIIALGAIWIIIGGLAAAVAIAAFASNGRLLNLNGGPIQLFLSIVVVLGLVWFAVGVLTCMKKMSAVYVGLVLSYFSLVGQLANLNVCSLAIVLLMIVQAHRVIGWAKQMRAAGLPLTAKP